MLVTLNIYEEVERNEREIFYENNEIYRNENQKK